MRTPVLAQQLMLLADDDPSVIESNEVAVRMGALIQQKTTAFRTRSETGAVYPPPREKFYVEVLPDIVARFLNHASPHPESFVSSAASLPHIPFSEFTRLVARQGSTAISAASTMTSAASSIERNQGYSLIGEILHHNETNESKSPLSTQQKTSLLGLLRAGLFDITLSCRRTAIEGVVLARDHESIPVLTQMSIMDPDDGAGRPATYVSVRLRAANAIQRIAQ